MHDEINVLQTNATAIEEKRNLHLHHHQHLARKQQQNFLLHVMMKVSMHKRDCKLNSFHVLG